MLIFKPSKKFCTVEEAILEAVNLAKNTGETYSFDCNGFQMLIEGFSDSGELLEEYNEYIYEKGIADGTIQTATFTWS